jgi:hypothetical protein
MNTWGVTGEDEDFQDGEGDTAAVSIDADSTVPAEEAFTIPHVVIAFEARQVKLK